MFLSDPRDTDITFSQPSQGEPFSFSLHDLTTFRGAALDGLNAAAEPDWADINRMGERFTAGVVAAERQTRLVETVTARENALAEAAANRIDTVRRLTGVQLENPFDGGYIEEAAQRVNQRGIYGNDRNAARAEERRNIFDEKIDEVATNFPEHAAALNFGQSLEDQASAIAKGAAYAGEHAGGGIAASLAGGTWGSRRDPVFLASLFFGPAASAARTVIGRIGMGALSSALYNAGLQALAQPAVQQWRADIGERHGVYPALENVGMAFLIGAVPGAAIEGVRALAQPAKTALTKMVDGTASPADVDAAARGLGVTLDDETRRALAVAADDTPAQAAAIGERPPAIPAAEHEAIAAQAVRYAEDPVNNPPPEIPVIAPERPAGQARLIDEALPGESQQLDGKPVAFARFDPNDLTTDAAAFQYKGGGDAAGVTDRLKNVTQWDPLASGKTLVFERADGTKIIADGHQRLGLAKRLAGGDDSIRLDGYLFREADGWTPEDVRAVAAKKNMQEGSGDAIDAARVLRDRPDLLDASLPVSSPMMKNAVALARLSDEAFGMAINGVVPPNYAAAVGSMVSNRLQHAAVLSDLVKFKPETEREARVLIGEVMAAGFRAAEQINLFGAAEATRSLMGERVKILDVAMSGLARDKKLFGTLAEKADAIEAAGNQLVRAGNDRRARDAAQLGEMLAKLARVSGPVSDALNRAAAQMADGTLPKAKAADAFVDEVRTLLDRDGLVGLLAPPELKPALKVEPATKEALTAAETANAARMESIQPPNENLATPAAESGSASQQAPQFQQTASGGLREFIAGQKGITLDQLQVRAQALQAEIAAVGKAVADQSGALFVNPGVKKPERLAEKLARKGYEDASQITDAARGGMIVDTPAQAEATVAALAAKFDLVDEGWKLSPDGYFDRKVLVRDAAGTVGEFQIIPSPMYEAKKGGGQKLYTEFRSLPEGARKQQLREEQQQLYSAASARLGSDWAGILETSNGPNSSSKNPRQASSDITPEVWNTSALSTADQGAPGLSTANAEPAGVSTAGRQSQLQNVNAMADSVGASPAADKAEPSLFDHLAVATRDDGRDVRFVPRDQAMADAMRVEDHADLVASCKS